jgi:hypothetical protein
MFVYKYSHGLWVRLAQPFGMEKDPVSGPDWADVWVIVVGNQHDALAISPVLLNSISDF